MLGLAMPVLNGLLVHPDGQRTTLCQGLVVLLPVADLVLGLTHLVLSETDLQDQNIEVVDSSPFEQKSRLECQKLIEKQSCGTLGLSLFR